MLNCNDQCLLNILLSKVYVSFVKIGLANRFVPVSEKLLSIKFSLGKLQKKLTVGIVFDSTSI